MLSSIFDKCKNQVKLTLDDAVELLKIPNTSEDFYTLLSLANARSRKDFGGKAYIFAQIGLNAAPCSGGCRFCSLADCNFSVTEQSEKSLPEILSQAKEIAKGQVQALFLMTTADYGKDRFLEVARAVKPLLKDGMDFVANVGDFDEAYGKELVKAGFTGVYHIVRLGEGTDTALSPDSRAATLDAVKHADLDLYYCVEPIGPEHTPEELAREMLRARDYNVDRMAVMRRVGVAGTKFESVPPVSEIEMAKIAAVARLVTDPKISMNVHEPMRLPLLSGVNQLYAEFGVNPRDTQTETRQNRGFGVEQAVQMLADAEWIV